MTAKIFEFDISQKIENKGLFNITYDYIIGCDEAGRGPGAGPVYAAAVCFKDYQGLTEILGELNDSKQLTEKTREKLFPIIKEHSIFSVQKSSIEQIEEMNILNASLDAMKRAAEDVAAKLEGNILILIDGNKKIKKLALPQKTIVKGDSTSAAIAAASILAKVSRDNLMIEFDKKYPEYNFKKNKGYLTKEHIEAIKTNGICDIHRKSFLKNFI